MPAKEIKELRQSGKLEAAYAMANAELELAPESIWAKRNMSWVYYDYIKQNTSAEKFVDFIRWLNEIKNLQLPVAENMLFDQLCWQIGKMSFCLLKGSVIDGRLKGIELFETFNSFPFSKPNEAYSFLFKGMHKLLKETDRYIEFVDWWGLENFMPSNFEKEKLSNGSEVMALAEQAYICYAKHLLPKHLLNGEIVFDKVKVEGFLPHLAKLSEEYPSYQYPPYYQAKLLLALGNKDHMLDSLLPFARKRLNNFWVWEILADAYAGDDEKVFACYCKALTCHSPEEMLVNLRQKMANILISKSLFNEARTEIELLVSARIAQSYKIPAIVANWQSMDWFKQAVPSKSNVGFYKSFLHTADSLLFSDVKEDLVIVQFVNSDKKILNFIASDTKYGFFKYNRFLNDVKVGDILKVRFQGGSNDGMHQIYTVRKVEEATFRSKFIRAIKGVVTIPKGRSFGFIDDVFIHPATISKYKLADGLEFTGEALKTYNHDKQQWDWKLL